MTQEKQTLDYYMGLPYRTFVAEDKCGDARCYMAYNPELEGCMAQGDTVQEALANLKEARKEYIETTLEFGWDLPLPAITIPATQHKEAVRLPQRVNNLENVNESNLYALAG